MLAPVALALDFGKPSQVLVGPTPAAIAVLDANDDAKFDLVTANASRSGVSLLRGAGDGSFLARIDFPSVGAARGLTIADVNAEGFDDVVVANVSGGTVPATRYAVGSAPAWVAVDDIDQDGYEDLVATRPGSNRVAVRSGQDAALSTLAVGKSPSGGAIADFNEDGIPDLAVTNRGSNKVSVFLNDGHEAPPGATCVVPRLVRATLPVAKVAVREGGCTVGRVTRKYSRARKGRVIVQRPKAGTRLPAGSSVALVLSRGPRR